MSDDVVDGSVREQAAKANKSRTKAFFTSAPSNLKVDNIRLYSTSQVDLREGDSVLLTLVEKQEKLGGLLKGSPYLFCIDWQVGKSYK